MMIIISGCVFTFSELEKTLDEFGTGDFQILDRLRWGREEVKILNTIE